MSDRTEISSAHSRVEEVATNLQRDSDLRDLLMGLNPDLIAKLLNLKQPPELKRSDTVEVGQAPGLSYDPDNQTLLIRVRLTGSITDTLRYLFLINSATTESTLEISRPLAQLLPIAERGHVMISSTRGIAKYRRVALRLLKSVQIGAGIGLLSTIIASIIKSNVLLEYPLIPSLLVVGFTFAYFGATVALREK